MDDRHLYRCPGCGSVTRAHPWRGGHVRCDGCGRTFVAEEHRLRPERPHAVGDEGRCYVRRPPMDPAIRASLNGMRYRLRHQGELIEKALGRSPLGQMERMRDERLARAARALLCRT